MFQTYQHKADFLTIYIKEAHPADGWHTEKMIDYKDPKTQDERKAAYLRLIHLYDPKSTVVIDTMSNKLEQAYYALPERLYVIKNGKIIYKGGQGPLDYSPDEMREWLEKY